MSQSDPLKTALDELRMLMLGTQVLLGLEFSALFQPKFETLRAAARSSTGISLTLLMITLALLITPACHHRLRERGRHTMRMLQTANNCANWALLPFSFSIGLDFFVVSTRQFAPITAVAIGAAALVAAIAAWYAIGIFVRTHVRSGAPRMSNNGANPSLGTRIDQMLTEARVILPGAQALLGFQFLAMLSSSFDEMTAPVRYVHFAALSAIAVTMILLIAPAAIHRIAFRGQDDEYFLQLGSKLITAALVPLAIGLALDFFVALMKIWSSQWLALSGAVAALLLFLALWYALPLGVSQLKAASNRHRRTAT
jgi:hypothetical protein